MKSGVLEPFSMLWQLIACPSPLRNFELELSLSIVGVSMSFFRLSALSGCRLTLPSSGPTAA